MKNQVLKLQILCLILVAFVGIMSFSMIVKTSNIVQLKIEVSNLKEEIEHLNKQSQIDSMTLDRINEDYCVIWEENQIFSSMLSEIEFTEEGHEILNDSWDKHNQK